MLSPKYYDDIVSTVNKIAGFDSENGKYKAPSTAYNLGLHLKDVAGTLKTRTIKNQDFEKKNDVQDLMSLMDEGFTTDINKTVIENQAEYKRHKKVTLPTKKDISALQKFLKEGIELTTNSLKKQFSRQSWRDLAGYLLISLQLFNRRRAGELERILIEDFKT